MIDLNNHDYIRLVDSMGDDLSIIRNARVSSNTDWRDFNFIDAELSCVTLNEVDLTLVNLNNANLTNANLTKVGFICSNLTNANLTGANLSHSRLTGADLMGANLHRANLTGVDLWNCIGNDREIKNVELDDDAKYNVTYTVDILQIACKQYPIERWWSFNDDEVFEMDGDDALKFWKKYKSRIREVIEKNPAVDWRV